MHQRGRQPAAAPPGRAWHGGGGGQLPRAGRTEGQSRALAGSRSCKAAPAHLAHVQRITRADSDPGSFTALMFSLERTLPEQARQWIKHQYGFHQHHVCVHTQPGPFSPPASRRGQHVCADRGLGSPAAPKPDPVPAPAWSRGSSGWCSRDDAIQEMQVPFHSTAPTFPSAPGLFSGSQQRHGSRTEGWVPASPHAGLPPVTRVPAIRGYPNLRPERPWLLLKSSLHHW